MKRVDIGMSIEDTLDLIKELGELNVPVPDKTSFKTHEGTAYLSFLLTEELFDSVKETLAHFLIDAKDYQEKNNPGQWPTIKINSLVICDGEE